MKFFSSYFAMGIATAGIVAAGAVLYHQQTVIKDQETKFEQIKQELKTTTDKQEVLDQRSTNLEQREEVLATKEKAYKECFIIQANVCYQSQEEYDNFQLGQLSPTTETRLDHDDQQTP